MSLMYVFAHSTNKACCARRTFFLLKPQENCDFQKAGFRKLPQMAGTPVCFEIPKTNDVVQLEFALGCGQPFNPIRNRTLYGPLHVPDVFGDIPSQSGVKWPLTEGQYWDTLVDFTNPAAPLKAVMSQKWTTTIDELDCIAKGYNCVNKTDTKTPPIRAPSQRQLVDKHKISFTSYWVKGNRTEATIQAIRTENLLAVPVQSSELWITNNPHVKIEACVLNFDHLWDDSQCVLS
eukprot:Filipodium_phascolosomae@DN5938_c0_g1_i1.p1